MPKKPKIKIIRPKKPTIAELTKTVQDQHEMLQQGKALMEAMQTEIKQLTQMHRTQLEIIRNLSEKVRDC